MKSNECIYRKAPFQQGNGNPLIEAMPRPLSKKEFLESTKVVPQRPLESDLLGYWDRKFGAGELHKLHIPLPISHNLYESILLSIYVGYAHRNPTDYEVRRKSEEIAVNELAPITNSASCVPATSVIGLTATGKSTTILSCLRAIPQVICHNGSHPSGFKGRQLTWVSLSCPETKTPKGFVISFMEAVDEALGTDYAQQYTQAKSLSVAQFRHAARKIARLHHIGIVHVDEFQNLKQFDGNDELSFNFVDSLLNELDVPVIWSSTPLIQNALHGRVTTLRRLFSNQTFKFEQFEKGSKAWKAFVGEFYFPWLLEHEFSFDEEFIELSHQICAGLPGIFTRLIKLFYLMAIDAKYKVFDAKDHLVEVYGSQFKNLHDALKALRDGDYSRFEDMAAPIKAVLDSPYQDQIAAFPEGILWEDDLIKMSSTPCLLPSPPERDLAAKHMANPALRKRAAAKGKPRKNTGSKLSTLSLDELKDLLHITPDLLDKSRLADGVLKS